MIDMEDAADKRRLFEEIPVPQALSSLAVPTIISQLINLIYNMVDTFFIGRTGNPYMLAGVTVSFTLFMLTVSFGNLYGIGGGSLLARLQGQHRESEAGYICAYAAYGSIAVSLLYALIVLVFMNPLLGVLGASEDTIVFAEQYVMLVVVCGSLPIVFSAVLAHLLRNSGYAKQAGIGLSMGGILNIALDPLFMFVLFPQGQEVSGAAFATLLSNIISCVYLIVTVVHLSKRNGILSLNIKDAGRNSRENIRELYKVGVPSAILTGLFDLANIVLNALMASHGDIQLAAIGIVEKVERIPNAVNIGICQGMLPLVAYNFASGNHQRMNDTIHAARKAGLTISVTCMVLFLIFAPSFVRLFLDTSNDRSGTAASVVVYAAAFLRIRCIASPFQFMNYSSSFCMQGLGDGKGTMLHAFARELVFYIPLMFLLNAFVGAYGLAAALAAGEACGAMFALYLLHHFLKEHGVTV